MPILTLDPNLQPFEVGATLFAALAFPSPKEEDARRNAANAWCAEVIGRTAAADPALREELRGSFPEYAALDQREIKRRLRTARRRFRDRMVAARMARAFVIEALTGTPARLPAGMARLSLNQLSELVKREAGQHDPENVEKRVWRPSRPAIHLAIAAEVGGFVRDGPTPRLDYDIQDAEFHDFVVRAGETFEWLVLNDERFGVSDDELLKVRWAS
jgi:hypothetical protein